MQKLRNKHDSIFEIPFNKQELKSLLFEMEEDCLKLMNQIQKDECILDDMKRSINHSVNKLKNEINQHAEDVIKKSNTLRSLYKRSCGFFLSSSSAKSGMYNPLLFSHNKIMAESKDDGLL